MRLVRGVVPSEGTVEVCVGETWAGTICHNRWDENDAAVICRQLGYPPEGQGSPVVDLPTRTDPRLAVWLSYSTHPYI